MTDTELDATYEAPVNSRSPMLAAVLAAFVLAVLLLPFAALAQVAPVAPAPGLGQQLLDMVLSPSGLGTLATIIFGAVGTLFATNEVRRRRVALAVYHAFHIVEDAAAETEGTDALDKVAAGLKAVDDYMKANGWRALKPEEQDAAKLGFTALNGQSKLAEKVMANAQALQKPSEVNALVPPTP